MPYNVFKTQLLFAVIIALFVISKDQVNTDRGVRTQIIHYIFQVIMTI